MEVPRGFTRCDECEDGWRPGKASWGESVVRCSFCSGSGLVPTEKLREEARRALADYYGQECATDPGAVDAVLSVVADHTGRDT